MRVSKGSVLAVVILAGLVLSVLLSGGPATSDAPLDPRSDAPLGTSALVAVLERLGAEVDLSTGLPEATDDVALLFDDHLDEEQTIAMRAWVRAGGRLVVTDSRSSLVPAVVDQENLIDPDTLASGFCTLVALDDVHAVAGGAAVSYDTSGADGSCFGTPDGAFVVQHSTGRGDIVGVGGAAFLTNDLLDEEDNAVLAAALLAPRAAATVRVVDAPLPAGGGEKSLADLIGGGVRRAGLQLATAFVLYAVWRAIRLGRPVQDQQTIEIAGSELVSATGRLLERGRSPGAAAEVLRGGLRRSLRSRLGVPTDAPTETLMQIVTARTGADPEHVRIAIADDPVTTEAELVAVSRCVASVHQEVLQP